MPSSGRPSPVRGERSDRPHFLCPVYVQFLAWVEVLKRSLFNFGNLKKSQEKVTLACVLWRQLEGTRHVAVTEQFLKRQNPSPCVNECFLLG